MLTNEALVSLIQTNLNDDRMLSIQMYFTRLISRNVFGSGVSQYRVKNTVTGNYVTSLVELIYSIDPAYVKPDYYYYASQATVGDVVHPAIVILTNFIVEFNIYSDDDDVYTSNFGHGNRRIGLILSYMNESEPLKISNVKII